MRFFIAPIFIAIFAMIFFSCTDGKNVKEVEIKYREKNPIEILKIDSTNGNVDITGWSNDFIEINTKKIILSGLTQDLDLMDTVFDKNETSMNIKTKIPARVDGKIHLDIMIPFILLKLYINSPDGNISVSNYLGDIELTNNNGNISVDFQGNILRIDAKKSRINVNINTFNSADIVINNEEALTNVYVESVGKSSYLDIKSFKADINFIIADDIDHKMMITNKDKKINMKYDLYDRTSSEGKYSFISGKKGRNYSDFTIDISNENGKIGISLAPGNFFVKEKEKMFSQ